MSSNLPPGCNTPDGGIDYEFETAIENLANNVQDPLIINFLTKLAPLINEIWKDGYNTGHEDGREYEKEAQDMQGRFDRPPQL